MGRALERFSHPDEARKCYRLARRGRAGDEAGLALAQSWRREGNREEAAAVWREMIGARRGGAAPYIELAKYLEHVRKDPAGALEMTDRAIALLSETALKPDITVQETQNALQYRRQRLKRKLAAMSEKKESQTDGTGNDVQGQ